MDFSGKGTIVVGDKGEYGRRLVRYLESRIPASMHLCRCTCTESFGACRGAEYYLLGEGFYESLPDDMRGFLTRKKLLLISSEEGEGTFCRYHNPKELLDFILDPEKPVPYPTEERYLAMGEGGVIVREEASYGGKQEDALCGDESAQGHKEDVHKVRLTALYSPVYEYELLTIAHHFMPEGSLYLGAEDLGSCRHEESDMGDLCYYIHLREDNIINILEEMVSRQEGIALLDSPDMYFYLKELTAEDYRWFFEKLKAEGAYREIFLGVGNGFLSCPESLSYFDRVILVDSEANHRQNIFCGRMEVILKEGSFYAGTVERVYREELLDENDRKAKA